MSRVGPEIRGTTPIGRVTVRTLALNHPDYVSVRQALITEGEFPNSPE